MMENVLIRLIATGAIMGTMTAIVYLAIITFLKPDPAWRNRLARVVLLSFIVLPIVAGLTPSIYLTPRQVPVSGEAIEASMSEEKRPPSGVSIGERETETPQYPAAYGSPEPVAITGADTAELTSISAETEPRPRLSDARPTRRTIAINWTKTIILVWGAGGAALLLFFIAGHLAMSATRRRSEISGAFTPSFGTRYVPVLFTDTITMPCAYGSWKPSILIPASIRNHPKAETVIEGIIAHELRHIERGDVAFHLVAQLIVSVFWFVPTAWLVRRDAMIYAEYACDEYASDQMGLHAYLSALIQAALAGRNSVLEHATVTGMAGVLRKRVEHLNSRPAIPASVKGTRRAISYIALAVAGIALSIATPAFARTPAFRTPAFRTPALRTPALREPAADDLGSTRISEKPIDAALAISFIALGENPDIIEYMNAREASRITIETPRPHYASDDIRKETSFDGNGHAKIATFLYYDGNGVLIGTGRYAFTGSNAQADYLGSDRYEYDGAGSVSAIYHYDRLDRIRSFERILTLEEGDTTIEYDGDGVPTGKYTIRVEDTARGIVTIKSYEAANRLVETTTEYPDGSATCYTGDTIRWERSPRNDAGQMTETRYNDSGEVREIVTVYAESADGVAREAHSTEGRLLWRITNDAAQSSYLKISREYLKEWGRGDNLLDRLPVDPQSIELRTREEALEGYRSSPWWIGGLPEAADVIATAGGTVTRIEPVNSSTINDELLLLPHNSTILQVSRFRAELFYDIWVIEIRLDGEYHTYYGNIADPKVSVGDRVRTNQVIGKTGPGFGSRQFEVWYTMSREDRAVDCSFRLNEYLLFQYLRRRGFF